MKKLLLLIVSVLFSIGLFAQATAPDFEAVDIHGENIHLYEILDGGQYVLIDFFFTSCGACQNIIPTMKQAYELYGCNNHDVVFIEISNSDNPQLCEQWVNNYGIEYPTIAGTTGGNSITNTYNISLFPTVVLISPDHKIVENDIWPISSVQALVNVFNNYGIEQHSCIDLFPVENLTLSIDEQITAETAVNLTWEDANNTSEVTYNVYRNNNLIAEGVSALEYADDTYFEAMTTTLDEIEYCVSAVLNEVETEKICLSINVDLCLPVYELLSNTCLKEDGLVQLSWKYDNIGQFANTIKVYRDDVEIEQVDVLNTADYVYTDYGVVVGEEYNYYVVVEYEGGCSAESIVITCTGGVNNINENIEKELVIYPNPAVNNITISGADIAQVRIYNLTGQLVELINSNTDKVNINVDTYPSGTYFASIITNDNKNLVKKFVIK